MGGAIICSRQIGKFWAGFSCSTRFERGFTFNFNDRRRIAANQEI
jgi:hypothetical protein